MDLFSAHVVDTVVLDLKHSILFQRGVVAVAFIDNKSHCAAMSSDSPTPTIEFQQGVQLTTHDQMSGYVELSSLYFGDHEVIAINADDENIFLLGTDASRPRLVDSFLFPVSSLLLFNEGDFYAAGCTDGTIIIYSLAAKHTLAYHRTDSSVEAIAYHNGP